MNSAVGKWVCSQTVKANGFIFYQTNSDELLKLLESAFFNGRLQLSELGVTGPRWLAFNVLIG